MIKKNGGIFGRNPTYNDVVVEGILTLKSAQVFDNDITINGDLVVNGTTTSINTVNLDVDDKNISMAVVTAKVGLVATSNITAGQFTVELASTVGLIPGMTVTKTAGTGAFDAAARIASVDSLTQITLDLAHTVSGSITFDVGGATDYTADGGGITIKGTTDKTIIWDRGFTAWKFSDRILTQAGTAAAPGLSFVGDEDTGIIRSAANAIGFVTNGVEKWLINTSGAFNPILDNTYDIGSAVVGVRTVHATTFDTNIAAAGVTLAGTTLSADGTDANISISITPKGTGSLSTTKLAVDNITIDGNTISSTNAAGDILIRPDASGAVIVNGTAQTAPGLSGMMSRILSFGGVYAAGEFVCGTGDLGVFIGASNAGTAVAGDDVYRMIQSASTSGYSSIQASRFRVGVGNYFDSKLLLNSAGGKVGVGTTTNPLTQLHISADTDPIVTQEITKKDTDFSTTTDYGGWRWLTSDADWTGAPRVEGAAIAVRVSDVFGRGANLVFRTGYSSAATEKARLWWSGGLALGDSVTDPGAGNLLVAGTIKQNGATINFTNLTNADQSWNIDASNTVLVTMTTVGGYKVQFIVAMSWDTSNLNVRATNISGATVGTSGAAATVQPGDGRTYTISRNSGTGALQWQSSTLATGTTSVAYRLLGSY